MIPTAILDSLLVTLAAIWVALSVTILIDRYRFERRARRAATLEGRLRLAPVAAADAASRLSPQDFQQMVLAGLPTAVEATLATQLCVRAGDRPLRTIADGSVRADVASRITALQMLVSARRPDAYYVLDQCVRAPEPELAAAAVRMLIRLDDHRAALILAAALCERVYVPSRLAAAFDRMSTPRSDLLAPMLVHGHATVRFWGMRLAGRLRAYEWAQRARELSADPDPLVRRAAVEALGALGEQRDIVLLLTRFFDPSAIVRLHAARAAAAFPTAPVADGLAELLRDREWIVRAAARDALTRLGEVATAALIRTTWDDDTFAANSAAEVLFVSGATSRLIRDLLVEGHPDTVRTVRRVMAIGGAHLERGLLDQLTGEERARLQTRLLAAGQGETRR